ncbi:MAG: cyclic nucleotide-binding/CBS domain-containing protein [Halobacteriaceae archaeon]
MNDNVTLDGVASRTFVGVSETDSLRATGRLLADEDTERALVLRGTDPVGVVRAVDVLDRLTTDGGASDTTVTDVMSDPPPTLPPTRSLADAVAALSESDVDLVVITDDEEVYGVITARDLVAAEASRPPVEERQTVALRAAGDGPYSDQSICEACGSLSRELAGYNGQLLCPDCRGV